MRSRIAALLVCCGAAALTTSPTSTPPSPPPLSFEAFLEARQETLCAEFAALDGSGAAFSRDAWRRETDGSRGLARVLQNGAVIEKGAVSTTFARGTVSAQRAAAMSARGRAVAEGATYEAAALSIVLHARSPRVPTFRADVRVFKVVRDDDDHENAKVCRWFGGGADLTPSLLDERDATAWHAYWRDVCAAHDATDSKDTLYPRLKRWCDEYFFLPWRREHRGIGGIFFDDLEVVSSDVSASSSGGSSSSDVADPEAFARAVADAFVESWRPIVERHRDEAFTEAQKSWQLARRGRYVEFNLMADRGVRFGLSPDAIERVMVSAPPVVAWEYNAADPLARLEDGSPEARLVGVLRTPRDWLREEVSQS